MAREQLALREENIIMQVLVELVECWKGRRGLVESEASQIYSCKIRFHSDANHFRPYWEYWTLFQVWYNIVLDSAMKFFLPIIAMLYLTLALIVGTSKQVRKQKRLSPSVWWSIVNAAEIEGLAGHMLLTNSCHFNEIPLLRNRFFIPSMFLCHFERG